MPAVHLNGIDLYFELHGSGPPLLNISGTGAELRTSSPQRHPLNDHFTVCHFDQRGMGQSSKPDVAYTMADYAEDAAALMGEIGWDRAHVVGTSFGGMVAQNLALLHPALIDRLVLLCTSPGGAGGSSFDLRELQSPGSRGDDRRWLELLDSRNDLATGQMAPGMEAFLRSRTRRPEGNDAAEADRSGSEDDADRAVGAARQLVARSEHDVFDALPQVGMPTLVMAGEYDGIAPPARSEAIVAQLPAAELRLYDGGHLFAIQDSRVFPDIIAFLQGERR